MNLGTLILIDSTKFGRSSAAATAYLQVFGQCRFSAFYAAQFPRG